MSLLRHAFDDVLDAAVEHARVTGLAPLGTVDLFHARERFDAGCDADVGLGCINLANLLLEDDPVRAVELYRKGCDLDVRFGCYAYGTALNGAAGITPDPELARELLKRSCSARNAEACTDLADLLDSD